MLKYEVKENKKNTKNKTTMTKNDVRIIKQVNTAIVTNYAMKTKQKQESKNLSSKTEMAIVI